MILKQPNEVFSCIVAKIGSNIAGTGKQRHQKIKGGLCLVDPHWTSLEIYSQGLSALGQILSCRISIFRYDREQVNDIQCSHPESLSSVLQISCLQLTCSFLTKMSWAIEHIEMTRW